MSTAPPALPEPSWQGWAGPGREGCIAPCGRWAWLLPCSWPGPTASAWHCTTRLPRETLAFREELDVLKFLCKDLWVAVFQKQMDSLRTNHQVGVPQPAHPAPSRG